MAEVILPRGLRNNNPLNIRHSSSNWQGKAASQTDKSFVTFTSRVFGYRAAMCIIRTYMTRYNKTCVDAIVKKWAPPIENNTNAYIEQVCKMSGLPRYANIWFSKKEDIVALVKAMAIVENGSKYSHLIIQEEIEQAYSRL